MHTENSTNRRLAWANCYNIRDLGGFPTGDGRVTRYRVVVRSDNVSRLTSAGRTALMDYGVRTVIDLRSRYELLIDPPPFAPEAEGNGHVGYRNIPLIPEDGEVAQMVATAPSDAEMYRCLVDGCTATLADVMRMIAATPEGPVLVHCHAGKDRTGLITALLLDLVGVPADAIVDDYEQSNECLRSYYDEWLSAIDDPVEREEQAASLRVQPEIMHAVLAYIERAYSGVEQYLLRGGLSLADMQTIRDRLVGPS